MSKDVNEKIILLFMAIALIIIPIILAIQLSWWFMIIEVMAIPVSSLMLHIVFKEDIIDANIIVKRCPKCHIKPMIETFNASFYTNDITVRCYCPECGLEVTCSTNNLLGVKSYEIPDLIPIVKYKWNKKVKK